MITNGKTNGLLTILSGQVKKLAEKQGVDPMRSDIESHMDKKLDYHENRANLVKQFGLNETPRPTVSVSREEADELYREYQAETSAEQELQSIKAKRVRPGGNPTFRHVTKQLWLIVARYSSICPVCSQPIHAGETITLFEGTNGWAHVAHAQVEAVPA